MTYADIIGSVDTRKGTILRYVGGKVLGCEEKKELKLNVNASLAQSLLLNCPHNPGEYSQWRSQTVAQREGKCRAPGNNQFYIHDNSPGDSPKDRPRNIRNPSYKILPIRQYLGLSITLFVSIIRVQTKVSIRTTTISIRSIATWTWCNARVSKSRCE